MICPDLRPAFTHYRWEAMPHSLGVPVGCDWSDKLATDPMFGPYTQSGSWTLDEVALLFDVASQIKGVWIDIGGATGWTAAHLAKAGCLAHSIEPMYNVPEFRARAEANLRRAEVSDRVVRWPATSDQFFARLPRSSYKGAVIDGNHDAPHPLHDAQNIAARLPLYVGAVLFHDVRGEPVEQGVRWLIDQGFHCQPYPTCHGVAICWRGELDLPDYTPPSKLVQDTVWPEIRGFAT